jgi:hypothetical protein
MLSRDSEGEVDQFLGALGVSGQDPGIDGQHAANFYKSKLATLDNRW